MQSTREHYFYVSIAKFLFHHPDHGIVSVRDPIKLKDAKRYRLSPLILYGLTVVGLPIRWMTFTSVDHPRAFRDVLLEAWSKAEGLRGRPDILRINRHLAMASPELVQEMAKIQVQVEVADTKEKSLPAALRSAQDSCRWLLGKHDKEDRSLAGAIQALCQDALYDHDFHVKSDHKGVNSRDVKGRIQQWLALPSQMPVPMVSGGLDWELGPWLSSWESSLPPDQPRHFSPDGFDGRTWLLIGEKAPEDIVNNGHYWIYSDYDNAAEITKNLVACWPNTPAEVAKCAGITLRELQWFTSGNAPLDRHVRFDLEDLLGIEYDESMDSYVIAGPCVLMAKKPMALKEVYEDLSKGGDASPCEIVPRQGAADPGWRYVLINMYGEPPSIVMAPRGAKITERIPDLLMNFDGIKQVAPEFYRDVVATCARASREPTANIREMKDFVKRYEQHWVDCAWQSE